MSKKLDPATLQFVDSQEDLSQTLEIDGEEFFAELAARGLIVPRPPTFGERLYHASGAPWRAIKRAAGWIAWKLWGRRSFERNLEKQIKRMKQLAGIGPDAKDLGPDFYHRPKQVGHIGAAASDEHERIIKTKIVREELPKPDFDDSGLN